MGKFLALGAMLAATTLAAPAHAVEFGQLLEQVFGSSQLKDLGLPIFVLIGFLALAFFWGALRIGKRRQRRMIENYDDQMRDYSTRLRRGKH